GHQAGTEARADQAERVTSRLGDPKPLVHAGDGFGELATLRKTPGQPHPRENGGKAGHTKALVNAITFEHRRVTPQEVNRPGIVAPGQGSAAQIEIDGDLERKIAQYRGDGERLPDGFDGAVLI